MSDVQLPCLFEHLERTGAPAINVLALGIGLCTITLGTLGIIEGKEHELPIYLAVHGALSISGALVGLYVAWRKWRVPPGEYVKSKVLGAIMMTIVVLGLITLAVGMHLAWTRRNSRDIGDDFGLYIATGVSILVFFFILIVNCCVAAGVGWQAWGYEGRPRKQLIDNEVHVNDKY